MDFLTLRSKIFRATVLLCLAFLACQSIAVSQTSQDQTATSDAVSTESFQSSPIFRLEKTPISGGAELITIHARWEGLGKNASGEWVPMVSVLRDTLGDHNPENDRLRYLWPLSYTSPTLLQRVTGAVPFLYTRVSNKQNTSNKPPPPAIDLASADHEVWQNIFWTVIQNVLLDPYGVPVKASTRSYRRNITDYRKSQIVRALSVLSLYQSLDGSVGFSESEMREIQARLLLTDKTFGGLIDELNLQKYYNKMLVQTRDERGHNWEMLRQRAEAESLYFEPLEMPDGSMTHALLWVAKPDLIAKHNQRYQKRFLNIANPWDDERLLNWRGHVETRYFDSESRPVAPDTPGAHPVEMIPLALYGLDNPKIPALLVDFRDSLNPKKREMSRRLLEDVTRNILSLSPFSDFSYLLSRSLYDFVTGRRGMDINQPSRLRTYSQLKLLLALNDSLNPELRSQLAHRIEKVSLNPMENDLMAEARLARQQYASLIAYATRDDGLATKLQKDRRTEMVGLEHGRTDRVLFQLANILSFGKYVHREPATPDMEVRLDIARRLNYHTKFLREVSRSGPQVDVKWDLRDIRRSLEFISEHGNDANSNAINAMVKIFARTDDKEIRRACIDSLSRITNPKARTELLRILENKDLDETSRELISEYLNNSGQRLEPMTSSAKAGARAEQQ